MKKPRGSRGWKEKTSGENYAEDVECNALKSNVEHLSIPIWIKEKDLLVLYNIICARKNIYYKIKEYCVIKKTIQFEMSRYIANILEIRA